MRINRHVIALFILSVFFISAQTSISQTVDFDFMFGWGVNDGAAEFQICSSAGTPCQEGIQGGGAGQFGDPTGTAVDDMKNIYVADFNNNRIQVFDSAGNFLFMFGWGVNDGTAEFQICSSTDTPCQEGIQGGGAGQFNIPQGIAVDGMKNIYVLDRSNNRIQVFDSAGNFLFMFGWGVDTGAAEFQICSTADTPCQAGTFGSEAGQFALPLGIAVDGMKNIYVADSNNQRIQVFDSAGNFLFMFGWGVNDGTAEFQICSTADTPCQEGLAGVEAGQFF
jgi:NHL repeat